MRALDSGAVATWARSCVRALDDLREEIDSINVYPVPDSDTGSNMLHTVAGAHAALAGARPSGAGQALALLARGALGSARGNSGVIAAQLLRGMAQACADAQEVDAALLVAALRRADHLATDAVAHPVEGTMLTVLRVAAMAAERASGEHTRTARASTAPPSTAGTAPSGTAGASTASTAGTAGTPLAEVAMAAVAAAATALADTPHQLAVLAEAGVVDAGGRGVLVLLDELAAMITGEPAPARPEFAPPRERPVRGTSASRTATSEQPWEVMYLLDGVNQPAIGLLRHTLGELGDCVTIAGDDDGRHAVHVHCGDIGAAIEAGLRVGRPRQIRVESLGVLPGPAAAVHARATPDTSALAERAVVAVVNGDALAELCRHEGITVLGVADGEPPSAAAIERTIIDAAAAHVTVLPGGIELTAVADEAAARVVAAGRDVVVVPCASPVQVLAALAVHDATRRAGDDVVAMAEAAAATRRGELSIAEQDAITWVGRVNAGDLVGFLDDEVVLIESAAKLTGPTANAYDVLVDAAMAVLGRMLASGGDLVTVLLGAAAPDGIEKGLAERLADAHPELEVASYEGGQTESVLTFGVE